MWYYNVPYKYHSTAVWYFVVNKFFFCGISYGIFSTTWVPQATLLQYHRTLCGTSLSLWYFLWYYAVPQEYHRNTTRFLIRSYDRTQMRKTTLGLLCVDDWLSKNWTVGAHGEGYGWTLSVAEGLTVKIRIVIRSPSKLQTEPLGLDYIMQATQATRNSQPHSYQVPYSRTESHRQSFFPRTVRDWNALPRNTVTAPSVELELRSLQVQSTTDSWQPSHLHSMWSILCIDHIRQ